MKILGERWSWSSTKLKVEMLKHPSTVWTLQETDYAPWSESGRPSLRPELTARPTTVTSWEYSHLLSPRKHMERETPRLLPTPRPPKLKPLEERSTLSSLARLPDLASPSSPRTSLVKTIPRRSKRTPRTSSPFSQSPSERSKFSRDPNSMVFNYSS